MYKSHGNLSVGCGVKISQFGEKMPSPNKINMGYQVNLIPLVLSTLWYHAFQLCLPKKLFGSQKISKFGNVKNICFHICFTLFTSALSHKQFAPICMFQRWLLTKKLYQIKLCLGFYSAFLLQSAWNFSICASTCPILQHSSGKALNKFCIPLLSFCWLNFES